MRAALTKLSAIWAVMGGLVLLTIVGVTVTNVGAFALDRLARLAGNTVSGLPGYEDFVRLAVACAIPMFLPYCQAKRGHLSVDLFLRNTPDSFNRFVDRFSLFLTAAIALFLAYWMILGMQETKADGGLSRVLGWEEWRFYLPGIASLILWALVALSQTSEDITVSPTDALHG